MKTRIYFYSDRNTSTYYIGNIAVATLDHNSDFFESFEDIDEKEKESIYYEMKKDRESMDDWDVAAEQGDPSLFI